MAKHKLTHKEEVKGGEHSHHHHHKMAKHHHAEMKKHIDHLHKMAKVAQKAKVASKSHHAKKRA